MIFMSSENEPEMIDTAAERITRLLRKKRAGAKRFATEFYRMKR